MPFRLNALGSLVVQDVDRPLAGPSAQRRTLALLVYLADGAERGVARDKLIGVLWPDTSDERARHALAQTLYRVRQSFGTEAVSGVDVLRLESSTFSVDFTEFEEAARAKRFDDAIALYRGPFLDGFVLPDAPEFERWSEERRGYFATLHRQVLQARAEIAEQARDHAKAIELWRALANLDPLNSRVAARLIRALTAGGQRPAALQFARVHETLLRVELDAVGSGEFLEAVRDAQPRPLASGKPADPPAAEVRVESPPPLQPPLRSMPRPPPPPPMPPPPDAAPPLAPASGATFQHTTETLRVAIPRRKLRRALIIAASVAVALLAIAFARG